MLESLRAREHGIEEDTLAARIEVPRRRDATKTLDVRVTPEQRAFLKSAAKRVRANSIDESSIVAMAISVIQALDLPWEAVSSREVLQDTVRRRLRAR